MNCKMKQIAHVQVLDFATLLELPLKLQDSLNRNNGNGLIQYQK